MKNLLLFLMMSLPCIVSGQDQLTWIPWDCESGNPVYNIPTADRQTLVRFNASWPANETHQVRKCFFSQLGNGGCISIGQFSGGDHVISMDFPYSTSWAYWCSYFVALQKIDGSAGTNDMFITTEPTPFIETTSEVLDQANGDSIFLASTSRTVYETSWGEIMPQCQTHKIFLVHEVRDDNTVIFRDSLLWQTEQIPFPVETLSSIFFYEKPLTELCVRAFLKKTDVSAEPTFPSQIIAESEPVCVIAGDGNVGYHSVLVENVESVHVFPNPCANILTFKSSIPLSWHMMNTLGYVVATGRGTKLDMSDMSFGVYTLIFPEKNSRVRVVHE